MATEMTARAGVAIDLRIATRSVKLPPSVICG
jgi:hypothetical protein